MRLKSLLAITAAAAAVWAAWPTDADAQRRRSGVRYIEAYPGARYVRTSPSGRTRVVVRRQRSFLDAGTEVSPGSQSYQNYAAPAIGGPDRYYDPTGSRRFPLPDSYDLPGYTRY